MRPRCSGRRVSCEPSRSGSSVLAKGHQQGLLTCDRGWKSSVNSTGDRLSGKELPEGLCVCCECFVVSLAPVTFV